MVSPDMTIISGHQRLKACKDLGFKSIPVIINDSLEDEDEKLKKLIAANFGRLKNDPVKQAKLLKEYEKLQGIKKGNNQYSSMGNNSRSTSQEDIAKELGVDVTTIRNLKRLTTLIPEIQDIISDGKITPTTGYKVLAKLSEDEQKELFESLPVSQKLTQNQVQEYVDKIQGLENQVKGYELKLSNRQNNDKNGSSALIDELIDEKNELEAEKLKEYERAEQLKKEVKKLREQKEKEVIKEVVRNVVPDDYHKNKEEREKLEVRVKSLQDSLNEERKKVQDLTPKKTELPELNFEYFNQTCDTYLQYINMYAYKDIEFSRLSDAETQQYHDTIDKVSDYLNKIRTILTNSKNEREAS